LTTLSTLPPSLVGMFERIDAAEASSEHLRTALDFWLARRGKGLYAMPPALSEVPEDTSPDVFICAHSAGEAQWRVIEAGKGAASLLSLRGDRISDVGNHQLAERLQRLFDWVAETGEPLAADFELDGTTPPPVWCEALAAPLSADGKTVTGILAGLVARPQAGKR